MALEAASTLAIEYTKWRKGQAQLELPRSQGSIAGEDDAPASRAQGERSGAHIALIPIVFRLASMSLSDACGARESARIVADECTRVARTAEDPHLWNEAAKLVVGIFEADTPWQQLTDQGNEYAQRNEAVLHIICYAGAILHARPKDALKIQLIILPALEPQLEHYGIFRRIVVPFVLNRNFHFQFWDSP